MGYRTVKRALGETNIERKCRVLFGLSLGLLIFSAFYWVGKNGENLVIKTTNRTARDYVGFSLVYIHWEMWQTKDNSSYVLEQMRHDLLDEEYELVFMALGSDEIAVKLINEAEKAEQPESDEEKKILEGLREKWKKRISDEMNGKKPDEPVEHLFDTLLQPEKDEYNYYQPIFWKKSCLNCHDAFNLSFAAVDNMAALDPTSAPFRVVRVTLPFAQTQAANSRMYAILYTTAILTIFIAMIALYVIVRYVIVKPLQHLRDVSEEISRGNTELRADIHTGDEFEELGDAFNRMLRHLIEAQSELRNVNTDLDIKVDELAQVNMRLYEMNRLKSDFLANMSHELRTPLNSIIGFSEVLQGIDSLTDKQKRYAHNIQKSGRVLLEMINDILDLAKLEAGKMEVRPSEFRIDAVVSAQCDMVQSLTEEKNIDLEVNVSDTALPVFQDQAKVQQILTNLLSNAIKFTPEGGRIIVSVSRTEQEQLELTVADTGVGIHEDDYDIIFEKFRQSEAILGNDGLTREYTGTGLGLSIIKELCILLGGEITFESELGIGSTFKISLPWSLPTRLKSSIHSQLDELTRPHRDQFPVA
jgi:signal transduction histidine kinase